MKWQVLITCSQLQQTIEHYRDLFAQHGIEIELPSLVQRLSESELLEIIDRFDGVIAGDDEFTGKVIAKAKLLKVISKWGVGTDAIDLEAAKESGIRVYNTANVFADEVADVVTGYIILLTRQLHKLDSSVRGGGWMKIQGSSPNRHMLGERQFALMKTGVYIVNTARGALIDEVALVQALREGKVAGAALDVFEQEPLPQNSPLREFDNCIFGTHNSSNTFEAVMRVNELAIRNLLDGLESAGQ